MKKTLSKKTISKPPPEEYGGLIGGIATLLETARHSAARAKSPKIAQLAGPDIAQRVIVVPRGAVGGMYAPYAFRQANVYFSAVFIHLKPADAKKACISPLEQLV